MQKPKIPENPAELTALIQSQVRDYFGNIMTITHESTIVREKGYYGVCFARPSKNVRSALSIDRELLILISTFEDQQTRTVQTARELISETAGRLDSSTFIVIHRDARGNAKLKKWGREQGLAVLPIFFEGALPAGDAALHILSHELFSYDVFDVTGPVADDLHFYGRREEARDLARKLQTGQIRSCFGIRKIGKTSILHRVVNEVRANYECTTFLVDAQTDAVFNLNAATLINSLAFSLEAASADGDHVLSIVNTPTDLAISANRLQKAIDTHDRHVLFVFDEVDYLTPNSPTATHWRAEFNSFWRNIRAIYQASASKKKNFSLLISGVSSKWFAEESIDGVENAALSFVPDEYLSPLPRGAAGAMIRRLGRTAGLQFSDSVADMIAETCADMPFWIRKACSFIHSKIDIGLRPFEPQRSLISDYLREFVASDGSAMSEVALAHLFRVYPELRQPARSCFEGKVEQVGPRMLRVLQKYGVVNIGRNPTLSGQMMTMGLRNLNEMLQQEKEVFQENKLEGVNEYGEWADELAIISRRRNILEKKLRNIIGAFLRFSAMSDPSHGTAKERILKCVDAKRRGGLQRFDIDELVSKLYWLELISIIKKEWIIFEKIFGDQISLDQYASLVNDRPDAHAKDIDMFDAAMHRRSVGWFEDRLGRI